MDSKTFKVSSRVYNLGVLAITCTMVSVFFFATGSPHSFWWLLLLMFGEG